MLLALRKRRSSSKDRGFTIFELLVVMAIILIMASIAIPSYVRMRQVYRIRGDADSLMGMLSLARMRAASDFARTKVECDSSTNVCTLFTAQYNPANCPVTWPGSPNEIQKITLSPGIMLDTTGGGAAKGVGGQKTTAPALGRTGQTNPYKIFFNSRGLPIQDNCAGTNTLDYALYLKDTKYGAVMAVSVDASGLARIWTLGKNGFWEGKE